VRVINHRPNTAERGRRERERPGPSNLYTAPRERCKDERNKEEGGNARVVKRKVYVTCNEEQSGRVRDQQGRPLALSIGFIKGGTIIQNSIKIITWTCAILKSQEAQLKDKCVKIPF